MFTAAVTGTEIEAKTDKMDTEPNGNLLPSFIYVCICLSIG